MRTFDAFQRLVWSPQFKQLLPPSLRDGGGKSFLNDEFEESSPFSKVTVIEDWQSKNES